VSVVANVAINVDSRGAVNQLKQVETRAQATERAFGALQQAAAAFGAGFALSKVIADVRELDTNLRRLGTVGGDVKALDKELGTLSKQLDGVASKAELAAASYQALSAGFTDTAGNIKVVEAATKAAVGGLADTTQVTAVLTKTLNAYNMSGSQAVKVTDSISKAIEFGQVEWSDYTSQLGRVASIAAIAGVSLDEVNAFIAAATKNGATAEIAFTGLGATLNTLLQPSKESTEAAAELGIQWNLAGLQGKGFDGLIAELAKKMGTNQEAAVRLLGSQEALRGAFAAAAKGGKDYEAALTAIGGAAGKTDQDFQTMKTSVENQLKALDTAFKNLSEALGLAFGPAVLKSVTDLTDTVNGFAGAIKTIPQPVASAVVELVKIVAQMVLLQKAMQAIIALRVGFVAAMTASTTAVATSGTAAATTSSAYALYARNTQTLAAQSAAATAKVTPLGNALRSIASIGIITVGINLIVNGLSNAIRANQEIAKLRGQRAAGGAAAMYGGTAPAESKQAAAQTLKAIQAERKRGVPVSTRVLGSLAGLFGQQTPADVLDRINVLRERELAAKGVLGLQTRAVTDGTGTGAGAGAAAGAGGGDSGKKKKGKTDAERAAERAARIQAEIQGLQRQTALTKQLTFLDEQIANAEADKNKELVITLQAEEKRLRIAYQLADELARSETQGQRDAALANAIVEADRIRVGAAIEMSKQEEERYERYQDLLTGLDREIQLAGIKDEAAKKLRQIEFDIADLRKEGLYTEEQLLAIQQKRMALITTDTKGPGQKRMEELRTELINLTNLENISITAADNIGTAFGQAFQEIINGSSSAQEALANMMRSIGENFINMAAQIIAKQTTMVILGTILKALGIGGGAFGGGGFSSNAAGFGGSVDAGIPALPNIPDYSGAFRANGGPVSAGSPYVVGEHGPELFVPGRNGSVVSNSGLRDAMGSAPSSGSPVLNMSFQTTSIGGVEYVSRDQLEAAMAETRRQATRDGANRGMTMTLDRIKQSPQTRSRIGIR